MDSTSVSLLRRLQSEDRDLAWDRFVELYAPLIYHWSMKTGLTPSEAADCVQDVLVVLLQKLPTFTYDLQKSFRGWLRTVTVNKCRDAHRRSAAAPTQQLDGRDFSAVDDIQLFTDQEYVQHVVQRAMEVMQSEFESTTWQACWRVLADDQPAAVVASDLGISPNAVYLAKSRVLRRLRESLDGLLD